MATADNQKDSSSGTHDESSSPFTSDGETGKMPDVAVAGTSQLSPRRLAAAPMRANLELVRLPRTIRLREPPDLLLEPATQELLREIGASEILLL